MATSFTMSQVTQDDKTITRSITNINPEASDSQISAFAKGLNNLTTNRLGTVNRIDKKEIDTSETFADPTIMFETFEDDNNAITTNQETKTITINATTAADTEPYVIATLRVNGNTVSITKFITELITDTPHVSVDLGAGTVSATEMTFAFFKGTAGQMAGALKVTIPAGSITIGTDVVKYNPVTITATVTE